MKKLLFLVFFYNSTAFSQDIDAGSLAVLVSSGQSSGSGFYMVDTSTHLFLFITACHVLLNPQGQIFSDSITLVSYKKNSQSDSRDSFKISLNGAYNSKMFKFDIKKDIAVLAFGKDVSGAIAYLPFVTKITKANTYLNLWAVYDLKMIKDLNTTSDVFTMGYPKSLAFDSTFDFNRPLIRKGIIAGIDLKTKKIIIDSPSYQGNSGGPVMEIVNIASRPSLIGLSSQFVPFVEHWVNQSYGYANTNIYNSGYSVIVPADHIYEQILLIGK